MGRKNKGKDKKGASSSSNDDALGTSSGQSNTQNQATNPLTVGEAFIRESYIQCCRQFYTLPELIEYMTTKYPGRVTAKMATDVFREMMTGQNADKYLRASQHHYRVRQQQRMERERLASASVSTHPASDAAGTSTPPASDAAGTITSVSTPRASDAASTSTPPASDAASTSTAPPQSDGASSSSS